MPAPDGHFTVDHAVQFYGDDHELAVGVAGFLGEALADGGSAVVVATAAHRSAFEAEIPGAAHALRAGRLLMVDAGELLDRFLDGDRIDRDRFGEAARSLVGRAEHAGRPVRIYAEMVALLWDAGRVMLALELEALWNELAARLPFSLLCGYPARLATEDDREAAAVPQVCDLHSAVTGGSAPAARRFPGEPASVRAARRFVLAALDPGTEKVIGVDAAIVAAELAANAVVHARSEFTVTVSSLPEGIRISVRDHTPANGTVLRPRPGHGLHMVAQVAARWSVDPLPDGKTVWAELYA